MVVQDNSRRPLAGWFDLIEDTNSAFHRRLDEVYGDDCALKEEAARMCRRTLDAFADRYGPDREVMVIRSTGRVNLVGTHIDHRGGSVNPIAIKHMWLVVEPRDDDLVLAKNVEADTFPDEQFYISDCLPAECRIENWDAWCHDEFEKRRGDPSVTWSNYIRAAVLHLQHLHTNEDGTFRPAIAGMNMMVYGNVPLAAGLSSSSAVVMLAAEAVVRINNLGISRENLAQHCGHAEWYVGTRGGYSDHAAIVFGKSNSLLHITAFPMEIETAAFPPGYSFVLANTLIEAKKQASARNAFNSRVAAYMFGLAMIRTNFPSYADKLEHLRDVNPGTLGVDEAQVYRMVKSLPVSASRSDVLRLPEGFEQAVRQAFRSHDEPEAGYTIRQICLYGIAECIRAQMVPQCLRSGDMETFGRLMSISHDGDRVTKLVDGKRVPVDNSYPNERIDALIDDLESGDRNRAERARLWRQGGGYNVSLPEIDMLVDIALASEGVVGAGLVGAGMGGCIAAVVEDEHSASVIENMARQYYQPRNLPVKAEIVRPVGGLYTMDV
ncbi:MAG: galactokinase [Planctomycetota bacterium]|jgi:N-acetylgalactosamine kinase